MKSFFVFFLILGNSVYSANARTGPVQNRSVALSSTNAPRVSAIYLIPSDKTFNPKYVAGIEHALKVLRFWYWHQMMMSPTQGLTFEIDPGPVLVRQTSKSSAEYSRQRSTAPNPNDFNYNVADEARLQGAKIRDGVHDWLVFIDADPLCNSGESASSGSLGIAVLPGAHLKGMVGEMAPPTCTGAPNPQGADSCSHVGSVAHEAGHSFGLHHPLDCPRFKCQSTHCPVNPACTTTDLMYSARNLKDPRVVLPNSDKTILRSSPFFHLNNAAEIESVSCDFSTHFLGH